MAGYNNFPGPDSKIQYCVVGSDDSENKPDDNSCNQRYYSPLDHGSDVKLDDLAFNPMSMSPTGFGQQSFPGIMDPGTPVLVLKQLGLNGGIALGQTNSKREGGGGSSRLGSSETVNKLASTKLNVNTAPDVQEQEEDGVKIRKIMEKGKQHSLDLLDGLPMHGALFSMAGFRLPDVKKVPTAKQTNDGMMNGQALQQMMGQIMSLAQMIQGLAGKGGAGGGGGGYGAGFGGWGTGGALNTGQYSPAGSDAGAGGGMWDGGSLGANTISAIDAPEGTHMYDIMQSQTPEMRSAINSLSNLLQGLEVNSGVSYYSGDVVHEETYLQNARDLLMQAKNVDELMTVLQRLQWDTSLFGQEKLDTVVTQIETAWGVALQEIDVNGNVVITYGSEDANNEMAFLDSMTSNTGAPALGYFDSAGATTDGAKYYTINGTGASSNPLSSPMPMSPSSGGGGSSSSSPQQIISQVQGILGQVQGLAQGMGQNMFGEAAETMKDMWKRMTRDQEQDAKKMHEKLNQAEDTRKMSKIVEKTTKGGNPIDMQGGDYDEGGLNGMGDSVGSGNFSVGTF